MFFDEAVGKKNEHNSDVYRDEKLCGLSIYSLFCFYRDVFINICLVVYISVTGRGMFGQNSEHRTAKSNFFTVFDL